MRITIVALLLTLSFNGQLLAQKGQPPKEVVTANVTTHFPQHEDFDESLVSRIKVPGG